MIRTPLSLSVKQVCTMIKKGSITFDNPIQRPPGQWNQQKKSDLIETIFRRFIPDFYATKIRGEKVNTYDIIDGLQRFTTICSFLNDEWELLQLKPIKLELTGEVFNISGLKYSQLPEEIQEVIKSYILTIRTIEFEEGEDEEELVEEIFYHLNSGVPMAKEHLALISAPKNVQEFCHRMITEHDLFVGIAKYSESAIKKSDKQMTILQSILLISGLPYESFAAKHVEEAFTKCEITDEILNQTEQTFTDIADTFPSTHKFVAKINIPIMAYMFSNTTDENKSQVRENLLNYVNKGMTPGDKYKAYTGAGNVKKEKVIKRIQGMFEICGVTVISKETKEEQKATYEDIQAVLDEFKNEPKQDIQESESEDIIENENVDIQYEHEEDENDIPELTMDDIPDVSELTNEEAS